MGDLWAKLGPKHGYLPEDKHLGNYWVIDIETDDLRPTRIHCAVIQNVSDSDEVYTFTPEEVVAGLLYNFIEQRVRLGGTFIAHNGTSYDYPTINKFAKRKLLDPFFHIDTMVMGQLYFPSIPGGHSLELWGFRLRFEKDEKPKSFTEYTPDMLKYCRRDVEVTRKLFLILLKKLKERKFSELSLKIEHGSAYDIALTREHGVPFDIQGAVALRDKIRAEENELRVIIQERFPPKRVVRAHYNVRVRADGTYFTKTAEHIKQFEGTDLFEWDADRSGYTLYTEEPFNLGSPIQRVERLLDLGWKPLVFNAPTEKNPKGSPKVDEQTILAFAEESKVPEVKMLAKWLSLNGRANMIQTWLNAVDLGDSRIHGYINSCGASTRRMTHSGPNTANIPAADESVLYGFESRALWGPVNGHVQVGYDSSGLEMRGFADHLGNEEVIKLYTEGDPHQFNADIWEIVRKPAKSVFYALIYGASDSKLGSTAGGTGAKKQLSAKGAWIRSRMVERTPGLGALNKLVQAEFESGFISTVDGGFVRSPESPHASLNYKLQSWGAIVMKLSSILIRLAADHLEIEYAKILDVHDEGQYSVEPSVAKYFGELCVEMHKFAGVVLGLRVPLSGEYKIGANWAETH